MRKVKQVYALLSILIFGLVLAACAHPENPPNGSEAIKKGEQVYVEYCAECHQPDGSGYSTLFPKLAGNPIVTLHDPEPIINTVLYGQGDMPSFMNKLDSVKIADVLSYIRNSWGNTASPVSMRQIH